MMPYSLVARHIADEPPVSILCPYRYFHNIGTYLPYPRRL